ncbi:hypothetical protein [Corallibacter sp.]|uniref:hypothetical protein n=1 Tax=Corallibacter sp. TaxID=2038084 RepID=UPI003AB5DAA9
MQHIRCSDMKNGRHTLIKGVEKLLGEHLEEAGTTNWEKYNRLAWCLFDEAAAIKERENQITSYKRDSNNTIIEDSTFDYNCEYIEKK